MKEFDEFVERFGGLLSSREILEILEAWEDECRNAFVLGVWDRDPQRERSPARWDLIRWLDAHPDRWTREFYESTGYRPSLREALAFPEDN